MQKQIRIKSFNTYSPKRKYPFFLALIIVLSIISVIILASVYSSKDENKVKEEENKVEKTSNAPNVIENNIFKSDNSKVYEDKKGKNIIVNNGSYEIYDVGPYILEAERLESSDKYIEARNIYKNILNKNMSPENINIIQEKFGEINIKLLLTPLDFEGKKAYVVKSGDSLDKIARKFGTTVDLLQKSNMISNPHRIQVGDRYKIFNGGFEIKINKEKRELDLFLNGEFFKKYTITIGKFDKTPSGTFKVYDKQKFPVWWHPDGRQIPYGDPENILGTRWMAIKATGDTLNVSGYGIHGSADGSAMGQAESAGCIRMRNSDVEELYMIVPNSVDVSIIEK
jgi:LysM repeat protein